MGDAVKKIAFTEKFIRAYFKCWSLPKKVGDKEGAK